MAQFTIRVELHGATPEHYETLHLRMAQNGFKRIIAGVDSSGAKGWWQLPTGEYDGESNESATKVRDNIKLIADSVKLGAWVLVTQVADRSWTTVKVSAG